MDNILTIENLKKIYHTKSGETLAIDDFSFKLNKGDFISIVGPSGCGKSTILSILSNLEEKSSGQIKLRDNAKLGYMLQNDCLFEWRNVLENCLLGLEINKEITEEKKQYIINLLTTYGLKDFIYSKPNNLSGGMRQRVALIRTLANNPDILLLDEPFSALDYQNRLAIADDLYKIVKNENKTVIMVTHDIAEAVSMSDKVIVMTKRPGKIKNIYDIKFENKTTPTEIRKDEKFNYYYEKIWKDLDKNA